MNLRDTLDKYEEKIRQIISEKSRARAAYLEKMAAAFYLETNIPARHCMVVEQQGRTPEGAPVIEYYFVDRRDYIRGIK